MRHEGQISAEDIQVMPGWMGRLELQNVRLQNEFRDCVHGLVCLLVYVLF